MKLKFNGYEVLTYTVGQSEQRVTLMLKIDDKPVDKISISISNWVPEQHDIIMKMANDGVAKALAEDEIVISKDDETPMLF